MKIDPIFGIIYKTKIGDFMLMIIVAMILGFTFAFMIGKKTKPKKSHQNHIIKPSHLMTMREKEFYLILEHSLPECRIFSQVAMGGILWTPSQATRNKFNRLIIDYVITDKNFNTLAIIELDDKSHDNKQEKDAARDAMLQQANYKTIRYRHFPDMETIRMDILGLGLPPLEPLPAPAQYQKSN